MVDGTLYANAAREYCNACQPARFDPETDTFTYRNEEDDDTFHTSSFRKRRGRSSTFR